MYIVGLDLGQAQDYSALCVAEQVPIPLTEQDRANRPVIGWGSASGVMYGAPKQRHAYRIGHLQRWPLGTSYTEIVADVKRLLATPPLKLNTPLTIDLTGVGRAIGDMFVAGGLRPIGITLTGGVDVVKASQYDWRVPKREVISVLRMLFDAGRLKIAEALPLTPILINELVNFKRTVSLENGHDSYESWRESIHDDLVLAVSLATWSGENHTPSRTPVFHY